MLLARPGACPPSCCSCRTPDECREIALKTSDYKALAASFHPARTQAKYACNKLVRKPAIYIQTERQRASLLRCICWIRQSTRCFEITHRTGRGRIVDA